jgi:hypothetical protein
MTQPSQTPSPRRLEQGKLSGEPILKPAESRRRRMSSSMLDIAVMLGQSRPKLKLLSRKQSLKHKLIPFSRQSLSRQSFSSRQSLSRLRQKIGHKLMPSSRKHFSWRQSYLRHGSYKRQIYSRWLSCSRRLRSSRRLNCSKRQRS